MSETPNSKRPSDKKSEPRVFKGTIVGVHGDDVIVEIGPRMQGVISPLGFPEPPQVGQTHEFLLKGQEDGLWLLALRQTATLSAWNDVQVGSLVKAKITGQNTGGLECKIGPLGAFMPASQVALRHEDNLAQYIGQTLIAQVLEVDPAKKRVLVSRRAALEQEVAVQRKDAIGSLHSGMIKTGKVTRVESFGAFVDLGGGLEGLVHVSQISHKRVESAAQVLSPGQEVQVMVMEIKEGGKRIGLSMKQLEPDPWEMASQRYTAEAVVRGKVVRLMEFGAFVELEPGIEGLLHVSQLGTGQRVRRVQDVVKVGEELDLRVISCDSKQKRISLSRTDSRGARLGSEDAAEAGAIDDLLRQGQNRPEVSTNLGKLFQAAFEKNDKKKR